MNTILDNLLPLLVTVITPILVYFANKLVNLVATKLQLTNVADLTAAIDNIIAKAVQAAEEWAMSEINSPAPAPAPTPSPAPTPVTPVAPVAPTNADKMAMAKKVVAHELSCKKLPMLEDAHVEALINAYCGRRRQRRAASNRMMAAPAPAVTPTIAEKITKKG
jgi:hypothetical protein